jgi:Tfp pilus assembly protein PilF
MHNLALAREAAGDYASARELLGRAIEIKPQQQYLETKRDIDDRERQYRRAMAQHERRSKPESAAKLELLSGVALLPDGPGEFRR